MNKQDLTNSLLTVLSTKKEAQDAVETLFASIKRALANGEKVVVSGFGSFQPYTTRTKKGRNPQTGELLHVAPRKKVRFKQSKDLM